MIVSMDPAPLTRPITDDEVATFWRDGVVCLRAVIPVAALGRWQVRSKPRWLIR